MDPQSDYDRLHYQCLAAMNELESLQKIHDEISSRCEKAEKELETWKKECSKLQRELEQVKKDRDKLQQDYEEIVLLREQEKQHTPKEKTEESVVTTITSSSLDTLQRENDDLKIEYDLQCSKYKKLQEDNFKLREQIDQLHKNGSDYDAMKQRFVLALMGFETALKNRDEMKLQNDITLLKLEETHNAWTKLKQENTELQKEKDSAVHEYSLVMEERESVHQEIAKLQDDLGQTKNKELELHKEREKAFAEKENFQKEVKSLIRSLEEKNVENKKLKKERSQNINQIKRQCQEIELLEQQKDAAKKERSEAMVHRDEILKECFEVKQKCTRILAGETDETKTLKDEFNKLCLELKAWKSQEVANQDWAFTERDKVIRERNKVLRELEMRKQDCAKLEEELKYYRGNVKLNGRLPKQRLSKEDMLPSQDSAIDTDSSPYLIERIELRRPSRDFDYGFTIGGGKDRPRREDTSIFILEVIPDSIADKVLKVNDCILQANNIDLTNVAFQTASDVLLRDNYLDMKILRHRQHGAWNPLYKIEIRSRQMKAIGLSIDSGLFIKTIEPGSAAAQEETLSVGDKIHSVNGQCLENFSYEEAKKLLKQSSLSLTILKPCVSTTSSHRSLEQPSDDTCGELSHFHHPKISFLHQDSSIHIRSPSAPIHYGEHMGTHLNTTDQIKSMSVINRMSDDDIGRMLSELQSEQRRRQMDNKSNRSDSFTIATRRCLKPFHDSARIARPVSVSVSAHSSKASVASSSGSNGRHEGNNSINSSSRIKTSSNPTKSSIYFTLCEKPSIQRNNGNFSKPTSITTVDLSDRYTSHSSMNTSKQGSTRSIGQCNKSGSSHGSLTSESVDKGPSPYVLKESTEQDIDFTSASSSNGLLHSSDSLGKKQTSSAGHSPVFSNRSSHTIDSTATNKEEKARSLTIEKGQNQKLGIQIVEGVAKGIFISNVEEGSIAAKFGIKYGDQLLEYQGINLRSADYKRTEKILRDSERQSTVRVLVQYNPHKMPKETCMSAPSTPCTIHRPLSPVSPQANKRSTRCVSMPGTPVSTHVRLSSNTSSSSDHSKRTYTEKITAIPENAVMGEPRFIHIARNPPSAAIGVLIIGGNKTGIFISGIKKNAFAEHTDLKPGDQILTYNGKDMQRSTLEEATLELGKPTEVADLQVQFNPPGYNSAQPSANNDTDSFYVRAQFDRPVHGKGELNFRKGDILHVTETLCGGRLGIWKASIVNENPLQDETTAKVVKGKIPSKETAEQELLLRRSSTYVDDKSKNRKSLFRRSKKNSSHHAINHSRESSDSKADVESTVSGGASFFTADEFNTYQYVKQVDSTFPRPVVILGAMAEPVCDKLIIDYSTKFKRCFKVLKEVTKAELQAGISEGKYIDFKPLKISPDRFEVIIPQDIKEFVQNERKHCLLDVSPDTEVLERIISFQLYPIVIFLKYKNAVKIKELRDKHYIKEKISDAKEMYARFNNIESKVKHLIHATIACTSLTQICKEVSNVVMEQQKKMLWVPDE